MRNPSMPSGRSLLPSIAFVALAGAALTALAASMASPSQDGAAAPPAQGSSAPAIAAPPVRSPADKADARTRPRTNRFLPDGIDWKAVVGPPPAPHSCEALADLTVVRFEQKRRSPAEVDNAWRGVALEPVIFDQPMNARFDTENAPKIHALLKSALVELRAVNSTLKREFGRQRPFDANPDITPVVPLEDGFSYPSSHAMRGLATALLLANIFPERRDALLTFGKQIGYSRVVGGVHYPSDIEAAFKLAEQGVSEILSSEAWRQAVTDASDEISQIRAIMVPIR
ncbi:MAG: phosphatase PAP2 family protein [Phycisphaerae bacterium]|nr:phosphatase PAP2 family protein [Phycisphaerae bacterium]